MATYYVDSNATGLNDGSSWTDAWTSIASVPTGVAGDIILVASTHSETGTSNIMAAAPQSNPQQVISTNTSTGQYQAGATFESGEVNLFRGVRYFGLTLKPQTSNVSLNCEGGISYCYECTFEAGTGASPFYIQGVRAIGGSYFYGEGHFEKCTFDFTTDPYNVGRVTAEKSRVLIKDCSFISPKAPLFVAGTAFTHNHKKFEVRNCDLSNVSTSLVSGGQQRCDFIISNCKLNPSVSYLSTAFTEPLAVLDIIDCDDGTITSRRGLTVREAYQGTVTTVESEYRSSGANDGNVDYSWKLVSNANAKEFTQALEVNPIVSEIASGSQTITVYVAGSSSLNDDDFWIEVESPSEEVSPTAQGKFRTTKPDPLATPTALTSDTSSTWNGSGVGTRQKIEVPISPTIAGTVTVRCYLAKPSTTVYVDPKISSDGYQYVYQGVLVDGYPVVSATTPPSSATFSQIIDNGGTGYSLIGSWSSYSGAVPGKYGGDYNYSSSGTGSKVATWSFTGLRRGIYQVSVSWAYNGSHTTSANYKAYSGSFLQVNQTKNQTISAASDYVENGVPFENLGGAFVVSGGSLTVTLDDSQTSGLVIADAVRIELVSEIESESGTQIFPFRQWVEDKAIAGTTTPLTPVHPLRSN